MGKESDFRILHITIMLYGNFHENLWEENFDPFLTTWGKNENEDENYCKILQYYKNIAKFEFSMSKLGYIEIFMKILGKNFRPIF